MMRIRNALVSANLLIFALVPLARADTGTAQEVQRVQGLLTSHTSSISRLNSPASVTANALLNGGQFLLCCGDNAWIAEGYGRGGGLMGISVVLGPPRPGDVVWAGYSPATYALAVATSTTFAPGVVVVWFGPRPPSGVPGPNWIDSLTAWTDDETYTLMGNMLSLWEATGEVASATARMNRTLSFWQNIQVPGAAQRNARYLGTAGSAIPLFHTDLPKMDPSITAGSLATLYLTAASNTVNAIAQQEQASITSAGQMIRTAASRGTPALYSVTSLVLPFLAKTGMLPATYLPDITTLSNQLGPNGFFVSLGYSAVDLDAWRTVRGKPGASAAWFSSLPHPGANGDIVINEHWDFEDAVVNPDGYDIPILPVSGFAQVFLFDLLQRSSAIAAPATPLSVSFTQSWVGQPGGAVINFSNNTVTGAATPSAGGHITFLELLINGQSAGPACPGSPCSVTIDLSHYSNTPQIRNLQFVAIDSNGNTGNTPQVPVILDGTMLSAQIVHPTAGATVSGTINVTGVASNLGGAGVNSMQLLVDGNPVTTPYGTSTDVEVMSLDTTKLTPGPHSLTVKIQSSISQTAISPPVSITVVASSTSVLLNVQPTTTAIVMTATPSTSGPVTISSVQFQMNGLNISNPLTANPYQIVVDPSTILGWNTFFAVAKDSTGATIDSNPIVLRFTMPYPTTEAQSSFSVGNLRNDLTSWVGLRFSVGPQPVTVTQLGRIYLSGNVQSHAVKLVRASDGTDVPGGSATVTPSLGGFAANTIVYANLASPVTLAANTDYYLLSMETAGGDMWGDAATWTGSAHISEVGPAFFLNGYNTWKIGRESYVPVSFRYRALQTAVRILAPQSGQTLSGSSLSIQFVATPAQYLQITDTKFPVDGIVTPAPGNVIDTTKLTNGQHTLTVSVTDSGGNVVTSAPVQFIVAN